MNIFLKISLFFFSFWVYIQLWPSCRLSDSQPSLFVPLGPATFNNSAMLWEDPCVYLCLSPLHVSLTQIAPPMRCSFPNICLQSTANQPRPRPLIIHRQPVTFVVYTSPVPSCLFESFDNGTPPTEKATLRNIYFTKMGSPVSWTVPARKD